MTSQEILKNAQLKITEPRKMILDLLLEKHGPFSVDEVYKMLKPLLSLKKLDLVTIYRCMSAFESNRLVHRCDFGDGVARYEFYRDPLHHHHHVICRECRKMEVLESCTVSEFEKKVQSMGYVDIHHSLEFFAICKNCRIQSQTREGKQVA